MVKRPSNTKALAVEKATHGRWSELGKLRPGFIALLTSGFSIRPSEEEIGEETHTIDCIAALVDAPDEHNGVAFTVEFKALKRSSEMGTAFVTATYLGNIEVVGSSWKDLRGDWQVLSELFINFRIWPRFIELFDRANSQSFAEMKRLPPEVPSIRWLSHGDFAEEALEIPMMYREVDGSSGPKKKPRARTQR